MTVILRKNTQIQTYYSKNDSLLKSGKIDYFAKAVARQNLQK